jgi:FdhD protein
LTRGVVRFRYHQHDGEWGEVNGEVIEEAFVSIFVNGRELATIMSTPRDQDKLALGFLRNENIIGGLDEVRAVHVCPSGACVDVWLSRADFQPPARRILTSGCGGGVTFNDLAQTLPPIESDLALKPARLAELMIEMQRRGALYARSRGVHTAALAGEAGLAAVAEDVGRHNTVDKLRGDFLLRGLDPRDHVLLTTGRISSEMISKAGRMGCPIVASRTSPTSMSVRLAREWNITLCGYVRRGRMNVYAHPERLGFSETMKNEILGGEEELNPVLVVA